MTITQLIASEAGVPITTVRKVFAALKKITKEKDRVNIPGLFTLYKGFRKGRSGTFKGVDWKTEDKEVTKVKVSKRF